MCSGEWHLIPLLAYDNMFLSFHSRRTNKPQHPSLPNIKCHAIQINISVGLVLLKEVNPVNFRHLNLSLISSIWKSQRMFFWNVQMDSQNRTQKKKKNKLKSWLLPSLKNTNTDLSFKICFVSSPACNYNFISWILLNAFQSCVHNWTLKDCFISSLLITLSDYFSIYIIPC